MLSLGAREREAMWKSGALAIGDAGVEVLRGLTLAESIFILDREGDAHCDTEPGELMKYNKLLVRHHAAKILHAAGQAQPE